MSTPKFQLQLSCKKKESKLHNLSLKIKKKNTRAQMFPIEGFSHCFYYVAWHHQTNWQKLIGSILLSSFWFPRSLINGQNASDTVGWIHNQSDQWNVWCRAGWHMRMGQFWGHFSTKKKKKKKWGEKWRSGHKLSIFLRKFKAGSRLCSARMVIRNCTA